MKNVTKSRSASSTLVDNTSLATISQNALSFQRITCRKSQRPPTPTTSRTDQSSILMNSIDNDPLTRSILIDNAAQQRGFLPYEYRIASTFESIYQRRQYAAHIKAASKFPVIPTPKFSRTSKHFDTFGNSTSRMSKLAQQRLILREKSSRKKHISTPITDKQEKAFYDLSDADFATDIPNALDLVLKNTKIKSAVERHLFDALKRERVQQARYRLLPINRAPFV